MQGLQLQLAGLLFLCSQIFAQNRTFSIDYNRNTFLKDGEPFRYVSGSIHYFRSPRESWPRLLQAARWAGLNAISTYIEWSFHEPSPGVYNFEGDADLLHFLDLAQDIGLYVLLRPGPYICAERDLGGYPSWLWTLHPGMRLRTTDPDHLEAVSGWLSRLMPRLQRYLYGNGGPVIMVQVENEYASWSGCQSEYVTWLRDQLKTYVNNAALLYTTDGAFVRRASCSKIKDVYATVDFGPQSNVTSAFFGQRLLEPQGPLVNSEFYPGWLTHWSDNNLAWVNSSLVTKSLDDQLKINASVNFYMFHGGTNFGFTSGANTGGLGNFLPQITSYDYDAPLTEAGDVTEKYFAIREVISKYMEVPSGPAPENTLKARRGPLLLHPVISLVSTESREHLGLEPKNFSDPVSFETLGVQHGLVLYETTIPNELTEPNSIKVLSSKNVHDRAYILLDNELQLSLLDRLTLVNRTAINVGGVKTLGLLVEDMGRINFDVFTDSKGIFSDVSLDNETLKEWRITGFPLNNISWIESLPLQPPSPPLLAPAFYSATFQLDSEELPPRDSFIDFMEWNKGIAWLNGRNIGRYWPVMGPQRRLFVPNTWVRPYPEINQLVILELYKVPSNHLISWEAEPDPIPAPPYFS